MPEGKGRRSNEERMTTAACRRAKLPVSVRARAVPRKQKTLTADCPIRYRVFHAMRYTLVSLARMRSVHARYGSLRCLAHTAQAIAHAARGTEGPSARQQFLENAKAVLNLVWFEGCERLW